VGEACHLDIEIFREKRLRWEEGANLVNRKTRHEIAETPRFANKDRRADLDKIKKRSHRRDPMPVQGRTPPQGSA